MPNTRHCFVRSTIRRQFCTSGANSSPRDHHAIGVVGSRRTSHYGLECAKKFSYQIAYAGLTVVSGLARGIDTAAHQGALAAKGRTDSCAGNGTTPSLSRRKSSPGRKNRCIRCCGYRVPDGNNSRPSNFPDAESDHQRMGIRPSGGRGRDEQRGTDQRFTGGRPRTQPLRYSRADRPAHLAWHESSDTTGCKTRDERR